VRNPPGRGEAQPPASGIVGLPPNATAAVVSALQPSLPDAFVLAVGFLQAGDVLLVEVQNNFGGPVEIGSPLLFGRLYPAVDDAVFRAVTCIAYDGFPIGVTSRQFRGGSTSGLRRCRGTRCRCRSCSG
jgi:hypothetical protein